MYVASRTMPLSMRLWCETKANNFLDAEFRYFAFRVDQVIMDCYDCDEYYRSSQLNTEEIS